MPISENILSLENYAGSLTFTSIWKNLTPCHYICSANPRKHSKLSLFVRGVKPRICLATSDFQCPLPLLRSRLATRSRA